MSRYIGDQNAVSFFYESGTYAVPSGTTLQWFGLVQDNTIKENPNIIELRYSNTGNRNVGQFVNGPLDYDGSLKYAAQDGKMLLFALGSNVDSGSPIYTHTISEVNSASGNAFTSGPLNPFASFYLEDSKKGAATGQNFNRKLLGCVVNKFSLNASEGKEVMFDVEYWAQSGTFFSGAPSTAAVDPGTRPYLWQDVQVHLPSGTVLNETKSVSWSVDNKFERRHYLNGSRVASVPIPTTRTYSLDLTIDSTSQWTGSLYDNYYLQGNTFNVLLPISAIAGSREIIIAMSGCKITSMSAPSPSSSAQPQENVIKIVPQTCSIIANDSIAKYNAW